MRILFFLVPVLILVGYLRSLETLASLCWDGGDLVYVSEGDVGAPEWVVGCETVVITYQELDQYHVELSRRLR